MVRLVENIPFFSIFIMMAGGIVTPLLGSRNRARILHLVLVGAVAVMSGLLLGYTSDGTCFRFMMGHFPAPWGNEVRAGALEALMSLVFSLVMFLTVAANKRSLEHDIPGERAGLYYVMMNLLFSSLLALIYTNDLFTAYVFIEIIYVFLTIFLYLLKCPQSLILSALRAFCFCGKPHISRSIFLYFLYQTWLKSW